MPDFLQLTADVQVQAADAGQKKPPRVSILAYTGGVMVVSEWGAVIINLDGLDITGAIALLADHENKLREVVGTGTATVRAGQLFIDGTLTRATEAGQMVLGLHADNVPLQASVGVVPGQQRWLPGGETIHANGRDLVAPAGGAVFIESGKLRETSITPLGSDSETRVSIAASATTNTGGQIMPDTHPTFDQYLETNGFAPDTTTTDMRLALRASFDAKYATGIDAERIMAVADAFPPTITGSDRGLALRAAASKGQIGAVGYEAGLTRIDRDFAKADLMVSERPTGPTIHSSSQDGGSPQVLQAAFCRSAGLQNMEKHFDDRTLTAADQAYHGGLGLSEMLLSCATQNGYTGRQILRAGNLREILQAAFSTHSITTALNNSANKFLRQGFDSVESVWRALSVIRPVSDFKENTRHRMTDDGIYKELPPGGEIEHGTLGEESYTVKANTFARMFAITRTDLINDDLSMFDSLRKVLGRGAGLKLNNVFWTAFMNNAAFFTSERGNFQDGAGTALSLSSLEDAEVLFSEITDASGNPLGQEAAILLTPKAISGTARTLFKSTEVRDPSASTERPIANIFFDKYRPLASSYLANANYEGSSALAWYLLADPTINPVMEVAFLDGQESPTVETSDANFNTLGVEFRGFHDFDCVKSEYRAGVKSKGEA